MLTTPTIRYGSAPPAIRPVTTEPGDPLATFKQQLAERPLNASRAVELGKNAHGLEGESIGLPKERLLELKTGNEVLDQANQAASELSRLGVQSAVDMTHATVKGGVYGSITGAIVGLAFTGVAQTFKQGILGIFGLAALGGTMGAIMRGAQAARKNVNVGMNMMFQGQSPRP